MQNDDGGLQSVALATKDAIHLLKKMQQYCACHTFDTLCNMLECHEVPRLPRFRDV